MFITLEGIEGSGKTTLVRAIVEYFAQNGKECLVTREPGGTAIGARIRSILLDPDHKAMAPLTELLLYMADRHEHVQNVIRPHLADGKIVISDRFSDATVVYQGYARGQDMRLIERLHRAVLEGLKPDITFLLDLPPEVGLARAWQQIDHGQRTTSETRFEEEAIDFHRRVREGYLELARREPKRYRIIDAGRSIQQIGEDVRQYLATMTNDH